MTVIIRHPDGTLENAIRKLSPEEQDIFGGAAVAASFVVPAFRDAIALMRPFLDQTAGTAYTDQYSRVGLSHWFFNDLDAPQRASVLLHESFHVLNNTFSRAAALGAEPDLSNLASDLEINCSLDKLPTVDLSFGIMPDKKPFDFKRYLTMEQYYHLIKQNDELLEELRKKGDDSGGGDGSPDPDCPVHGDNAQGAGDENDESGTPSESAKGEGEDESQDGGGDSDSGQDSDGADEGHSHGSSGPTCSCPQGGEKDGKGSGSQVNKGCDEVTEERVAAADDAGVERASDAEQSIAKKNTASRMEEEMKAARAAGKGELAEFLNLALQNMQPAKIDWRKIFRKLISSMEEAIVRGRSDYTYRRTSRRLSDSKFIFPGMVKYQPSIMLGIDTSGSMSHDDHLRTASEIEGILKATSRAKNALRIFSVDTQVKDIKLVDNVRQLNLMGGGGTAMEVAWKFTQTLKKRERPDIFILATDGYTSWAAIEEELIKTNKMFRSVILVTTEGGYKSAPDSLHRLARVVDISESD